MGVIQSSINSMIGTVAGQTSGQQMQTVNAVDQSLKSGLLNSQIMNNVNGVNSMNLNVANQANQRATQISQDRLTQAQTSKNWIDSLRAKQDPNNITGAK